MHSRALRILACLLLPSCLAAQCLEKHDYRTNKTGGIVVSGLAITGTRIVSAEVSRISGTLVGTCINENAEEMEERLRAAFQDRGYMQVAVKDLRIKPLDVLAVPKPVDLQAEVTEGQRYRLGAITFNGNHAFPEKRLRAEFPLKKADFFERRKIASGLEKVMRFYSTRGYLESFAIPDMHVLADARIDLAVKINEGKQYHMGTVYFQAQKELSEKLHEVWRLAEGQPFDQTYVAKFVETNRALLPPDFTEMGSTHVFRNCDDATVQVVVQVDQTPPAPPVTSDSGCEVNADEVQDRQ